MHRVPAQRVHHRAFVLGTTGPDFSQETIALAGQLRPLICLLDRQTRALHRVPAEADVSITGRQAAVLQLLSEGLTAHSIAFRLGISPRTVHKHLENLYTKLGVRDRLQAVFVAQRNGLLAPPGDPESESRARLADSMRWPLPSSLHPMMTA